MKNVCRFCFVILLFSSTTCFAQMSATYSNLTKEGDSLYKTKEYLKAAEAFGKAFAASEDKGTINDRYTAACSWALGFTKEIVR